jgi:hypothetical protein
MQHLSCLCKHANSCADCLSRCMDMDGSAAISTWWVCKRLRLHRECQIAPPPCSFPVSQPSLNILTSSLPACLVQVQVSPDPELSYQPSRYTTMRGSCSGSEARPVRPYLDKNLHSAEAAQLSTLSHSAACALPQLLHAHFRAACGRSGHTKTMLMAGTPYYLLLARVGGVGNLLPLLVLQAAVRQEQGTSVSAAGIRTTVCCCLLVQPTYPWEQWDRLLQSHCTQARLVRCTEHMMAIKKTSTLNHQVL